MNRIALVVFLASPFAILADDLPKPKTLTQDWLDNGWVLLFDGKTTFGWTSPDGSKWTVEDGSLVPPKGQRATLATTSSFSDYMLIFEVKLTAESEFEVFTGYDQPEKWLAKSQPLLPAQFPVKKKVPGTWLVQVEVERGWIRYQSIHRIAPRDVELIQHGREDGPARVGPIAFRGKGFTLGNIQLRLTNTSSKTKTTDLLNKKDLDGWKEHPGQKSKFSVTREGWLHVQDGKGDLQTTKEWADFVLQLECKSNGKHLNSGVFFRCLPNQYQMGYEAQIHNGFGEDKEYTLDVFDPKTNKPLEKKKEKYSALDFGTGAIYRRQPARFQASKDNEWFTMTVVAQGRHFATWVNGIQQVDWSDFRPLGDNARVGAYLKKGPISIQGHDPTTDLHFRNIRIAELPAK